MRKITEELLSEIIEELIKACHPELVYLFGSQARGDARETSDLDLLVVEKEDFGPGRSRLAEINHLYNILSRFQVPEDILLYSSGEFDKWKNSVNHIVGRCYREGKLMYARS